jgi:hypothetical protein
MKHYLYVNSDDKRYYTLELRYQSISGESKLVEGLHPTPEFLTILTTVSKISGFRLEGIEIKTEGLSKIENSTLTSLVNRLAQDAQLIKDLQIRSK